MRRILMVTVAAIILLCSTTPITAQASSILQTRSFRTNLVKGGYVEAEAGEIEINVNPEVQESVDVEPIDVAEEITTDPEEIEESEEPVDEHTDESTPTDIESAVDEEPSQSEEPVNVQLDAPENTGDTTEPGVETPIESEENEEEHETEVQSTQ